MRRLENSAIFRNGNIDHLAEEILKLFESAHQYSWSDFTDSTQQTQINFILSGGIYRPYETSYFALIARQHCTGPNSFELFRANHASLVALLEKELLSPNNQVRIDALKFIAILVERQILKMTKLFIKQLFPCIVKFIWGEGYQHRKDAFSIVSKLMSGDQGRLV